MPVLSSASACRGVLQMAGCTRLHADVGSGCKFLILRSCGCSALAIYSPLSVVMIWQKLFCSEAVVAFQHGCSRELCLQVLQKLCMTLQHICMLSAPRTCQKANMATAMRPSCHATDMPGHTWLASSITKMVRRQEHVNSLTVSRLKLSNT